MSTGTTEIVQTPGIDQAADRRDHGEHLHSDDWKKSMPAKLRSLTAHVLNVLARAFAESAYCIPFAPLPWPLIDQRGRVGWGSRR
jgi:hypothetical protein